MLASSSSTMGCIRNHLLSLTANPKLSQSVVEGLYFVLMHFQYPQFFVLHMKLTSLLIIGIKLCKLLMIPLQRDAVTSPNDILLSVKQETSPINAVLCLSPHNVGLISNVVLVFPKAHVKSLL
jgi:hypothetical protein